MKRTIDSDAVLARYLEGPALLQGALAGLGDDALDAAPAGGGWSIRRIVHHLVDGDDIWKIGIKAALGPPGGEFSLAWYGSRPQEDWADDWGYGRRALGPSLALFAAIRDHVAQLVAQVPDAASRTVGVRTPGGKVETVSVGFVLAMQADHVEHHVQRILAIRQELGLAGHADEG